MMNLEKTMTSRWPLAPLKDVLDLVLDPIPVMPDASYQICGLYSFGKGLFARSPVRGMDTTYKVFHRLHTGDLVLSQLKAWEGAIAQVTPAFDGWFLSPQFATFRARQGALDPDYLAWYCKVPAVWNQLAQRARGMGARRDS